MCLLTVSATWNGRNWPKCLKNSQGVFTNSYMPMLKKTAVFGHFGQFRPFRIWQKCQKAHLQAITFHMSLFPGLYDHPLQRHSLEKLIFRKPLISDILANFGHFRWPNLAKTVKRHIYRPRPFIWAYSQVSTTIRYKDTAWKRIDDGQTDRQTDTPNL